MAQMANVKIDAGDLARQLERINRDSERPPGDARPQSKLILGRTFITAMVENGLLPHGTTYVRITAELDRPIRLDYETYGTNDLVALANAMSEAETHEEAKAR